MVSKTTKSVIIDGVMYVPATSAVAGVDDIMQALYEGYMGSGQSWRDDPYTKGLSISVNEDGEGDSFDEFVALVAKISGRKVAPSN